MAPFDTVMDELLERRSPDGVWHGHLSSSALAGAVAVRALKSVDPIAYKSVIRKGINWLVSVQNADGGWGDTVRSPSNVSTTLLVLASIPSEGAEKSARAYLTGQFGSTDPDAIVAGILKRYGNDRTFSAPILALAATAGLLGSGGEAWQRVPQLPFELAIFPRFLFKWLRLNVVSYALPALIAIGYLRHRRRPSKFFPLTFIRNRCIRSLTAKLSHMQPSNGGFLEATPLTAFVTMALAEAGLADHQVVLRGVEFLLASMRDDGSWPIDTNLSTWITSQALKGIPADRFSDDERVRLRRWYEDQQFKAIHPFTGSAPGGWGWTPLPGSVPDADDTAGALIALKRLIGEEKPTSSINMGIRWLLNIQNTDGGVPTFCRGWGTLPFDRSCPDVTAHALEALGCWYTLVPRSTQRRIRRFVVAGIAYLNRSQRDDGSWLPLWFGNNHAPDQVNPCYGTAMVLSALSNVPPELTDLEDAEAIGRAVQWLKVNQNDDGGWGACKGVPSSREETALAIRALAYCAEDDWSISAEALTKAEDWLRDNRQMPASPIGLYFSSLWYFEADYPLVFSAQALAARQTATRMAQESRS